VPWYLDRSVLGATALATVNSTRDRLHAEHGTESPGRVVAGLSFGFWRGLFDRKNEDLWIRCLHRAFPTGDGRRRSISAALSGLHPFRNRLAHHEPIFHLPDAALDRRRHEIAIVSDALSPPTSPRGLTRPIERQAFVNTSHQPPRSPEPPRAFTFTGVCAGGQRGLVGRRTPWFGLRGTGVR